MAITSSPSRKQKIVMGLVCLLACAVGVALIWVHRQHPDIYSTQNRTTYLRGRTVAAMPEWMAIGVSAVFGLAGSSVLASAVLKPNRYTLLLKNLVGLVIVGFFAAVPIWAVSRGDDFGSLPFLPQAWSHFIGQVAFGLIALMLTGFTGIMIIVTIRGWKNPDLSDQ